MNESTHRFILYGLIIALIFSFGIAIFKLHNLSNRVRSISRFLDGDIFSSEFHKILDNYFAHQENIGKVVQHILPLITAHTMPDILLSEVIPDVKVDSTVDPEMFVAEAVLL
jgi:hypothetical protein